MKEPIESIEVTNEELEAPEDEIKWWKVDFSKFGGENQREKEATLKAVKQQFALGLIDQTGKPL